MDKINNDIEDSICSFELSKLLKEKGFDCYHSNGEYYNSNEEVPIIKQDYYETFFASSKDKLQHIIKAPTHSLATKWIRENFGINLSLDYIFYDGLHYFYSYKCTKSDGSYIEIYNQSDRFGSHCSIDLITDEILIYILTKLI